MKIPRNTVDPVQLKIFSEKITQEANDLFPDGEGTSYVKINVQDRTLEELFPEMPVPRFDLIEGDDEWMDAISSMNCTIHMYTERLNAAMKWWHFEREMKKNKNCFDKELSALAAKLNIVILTTKQSEIDGFKWKTIHVPPHKRHGECGMISHDVDNRKRSLKYIESAVEIARQDNPKAEIFALDTVPFLNVSVLVERSTTDSSNKMELKKIYQTK